MKICCILLLLLGFAAAKPTLPTFNSSLFITDGKLAITKDKFEQILQLKDVFVAKFDGTIVPPVVMDFLRNVTVDDFDALKFILDRKDNLNTETVVEFAAKYPDMLQRLMAVTTELGEQMKKLSKSTQNQIHKNRILYDRLKSLSNLTAEEDAKVLVKAYLNWPEENRKELDSIFPQLSVKAQEYSEELANDATISALDGSECRVPLPEQDAFCVKYNQFLRVERMSKLFERFEMFD